MNTFIRQVHHLAASLVITVTPVLSLSGCGFSKPPRMPLSTMKAMDNILRSISQGKRTFDEVLESTGERPYYILKDGLATWPLHLHTQAYAYGRGESDATVMNHHDVKEYAIPNMWGSGNLEMMTDSVCYFRIFVRGNAVIYMEHSCLTESDFLSRYRKVK
jgi:hypothetical protein